MKINELTKNRMAILDFELLELEAGGKKTWISDEFEAVFVIIEGGCSLDASGIGTVEMKRKNVFDSPPSAVYIPPKCPVSITASLPTMVAVCKARADEDNVPVFVPAADVKEEWRGKEGYKRKVSNILNIETKTQRIAVGETINLPGNWSSFPPHKHDEYVPGKEVPLEEIYFFRIRPEKGFGIQRIYSADRKTDQCYAVKDKDCVFIPSGYHPVANPPGHELYYLWMLAGNERVYIWNTDPDFKWLE